MKKILFIISLLPILFIGSSCSSGGGDGSGSGSDDDTACATDIIGKWNGIILNIDYGSGCSDSDINNADVSNVVLDFNEDNSYEIESNGNAYLADEQGTWECDSDEIHLCDLSDDCTTYDYEINGNNADVDTTLDDGGCSYNISFSVEQK